MQITNSASARLFAAHRFFMTVALRSLLTTLVTCGSDVGGAIGSADSTDSNSLSSTPGASVPKSTSATPVQSGWSGIIGNGQSLSVGYQAPLSAPTAAAPGGFRLADKSGTYDISAPTNPNLSIVPLTEPFRAPAPSGGSTAYPSNIQGKTPHSAMAGQISRLASASGYARFTTVHTAAGIGGAPMSDINKGGAQNSYAASLYEARALTALAQQQNQNLHYDGVIFTHGESDAIKSNMNYEADLVTLQANYAQDLVAITKQKSNLIPLFLSQQQTNPVPGAEISPVIQAQWHASVTNPNTIICVGPKYQYVYAAGLLHLPATGYDRLGEKYGQAFWQTVVNKTPFVPLSPARAQRVGTNGISVAFHVPVPPLNWDTLLPYAHQTSNTAWSHGQGFEVADPNGAPVYISGVSIDNSNTSITIALANAPTGPLTLRYAMTADANGWEGGVSGGRIGHLRDSDPLVGASAETLTCQVTKGSQTITCPAGLAHRAYYDVVNPGNYAITSLDPNNLTTAVLNTAWTGSSGKTALSFHHEHRNYLVSFTMPVSQ